MANSPLNKYKSMSNKDLLTLRDQLSARLEREHANNVRRMWNVALATVAGVGVGCTMALATFIGLNRGEIQNAWQTHNIDTNNLTGATRSKIVGVGSALGVGYALAHRMNDKAKLKHDVNLEPQLSHVEREISRRGIGGQKHR